MAWCETGTTRSCWVQLSSFCQIHHLLRSVTLMSGPIKFCYCNFVLFSWVCLLFHSSWKLCFIFNYLLFNPCICLLFLNLAFAQRAVYHPSFQFCIPSRCVKRRRGWGDAKRGFIWCKIKHKLKPVRVPARLHVGVSGRETKRNGAVVAAFT